MARYLAIDWDQQQLRVVEATVEKGRVKVRQARSWPEPMTLNQPNAVASAGRLVERLKEAGIASAPVIFAVDREQLIFRDIRYPEVPPNEVAAVVRFQAVKEIHFPADDAVIDFTPASVPWPSGEKRALAVVLHKLMLSAIQTMCETAGLRLAAVTPRSFGVGPMVSGAVAVSGERQPLGANEISATLLKGSSLGEVCITRGQELLFSRAFSLPEGSDPHALVPEVRRSLAAYATQFPNQPVQSLAIADKGGKVNGDTFAVLRLPVNVFDPCAGLAVAPEEASAFGCLFGVLQTHEQLPVEFLKPKQPPPPDTRKRRYALAAAAAVLLVVLLGGGAYAWASMTKDAEIAELQSRSTALKKGLEAYGDVKKRLDAVERWDKTELVVLDELYDFIARFPDLAGVVVTQVRWEPAATTEPRGPTTRSTANSKAPPKAPPKATIKPIGQLTVIANSDSAENLEKLRRAFDDAPHWKFDSWTPGAPAPKHVTLILKVFRQEMHEYRAVLGPAQNVTAKERKIDTSRTRQRGSRFQPRGGQ